jgi:hypothetical protein
VCGVQCFLSSGSELQRAKRISMLGATPPDERDNQAALIEPTYALH